MWGWLLGVGLAGAVEARLPASGLVWAWPDGEVRRWYLEDEVTLPQLMLWRAERNLDLRVVAWQLRSVLECRNVPEKTSRRSWEVRCRIEAASIRAASLPADRGPAAGDDAGRSRLQVVVEEYAAKLTGAEIQFTLRKDGRVSSIDLEGVSKRLDRMQAIYDVQRQMLTRAIAGFDVVFPRKGVTPDGIWVQYQNLVLAAPANLGSAGGTETVHEVLRVEDGIVVSREVGRGMVAPSQGDGGSPDLFDTHLEGATVFDTRRGMITERVWTALGEATASSAISEGFSKPMPYIQRGRIVELDVGESPVLPPSMELASPGDTPTALQQWQPINGLEGP